jgi:hypothetical protein
VIDLEKSGSGEKSTYMPEVEFIRTAARKWRMFIVRAATLGLFHRTKRRGRLRERRSPELYDRLKTVFSVSGCLDSGRRHTCLCVFAVFVRNLKWFFIFSDKYHNEKIL